MTKKEKSAMVNQFETALEQYNLTQIEIPEDIENKDFFTYEIRDKAFVTVRGSINDEAFIKATQSIQLNIPTQSLQVIESTHWEAQTLWISPDEFLVILPQTKQKEIIDKLQIALKDIFSAVVDVSGGYAMIAITGTKMLEVLSKFTIYDFCEKNFSVNKTIGSMWGNAPTIFLKEKNPKVIKVLFRWSFADYCWKVLLEAQETL